MNYEPMNLFLAYLFGLIAFTIEILILKLITAKLAKLPDNISSIVVFLVMVPSILQRIITSWDIGKIVEIALIISIWVILWGIDTFKINFLTNKINSVEWQKNWLKVIVAAGAVIASIVYPFIKS